MTRILLAADSEGLALATVPMVLRLLSPGDEVLLLHVAGEHDALRPDALDELERALTAAGARVQVEIAGAGGGVAGTVTQAAREFHADLVALGSHGRGRLGAALAGSVSQDTSAALACRVLVTHHAGPGTADREPAPARLGRILLPIGLDFAAERGLELAAELAGRHGAAVVVYHASVVRPHGASAVVPDHDDARRAVAQARLRLQLEGVAATGLTGVAWNGVPKAIAAVADGEDADLIVLDSRRSSGWSALFGGGITQSLLALTDRPLLLAEPGLKVREHAGALSAVGA